MGEDQRDGLRVFVLNEGEKVFRFGLLEEGERRGLDLLGDLLDDAGCIVLAERFSQQTLGVLQPAFVEVGVGQREVVELTEDVLARDEGDLADRRDFARDLLDGFGGKPLENLRRLILFERQEQDRGLSDAIEV